MANFVARYDTELMRKCLFLLAIHILCGLNSYAQDKKVLVLTIRDEIGPPISRYVELGLSRAKHSKADIVVVDLDTYGGALNSADEIRKAFLDAKMPMWVFINKNAASAGALISISCDSIYMAPGSNIGAASVVTESGEPAPEKYQSYMRSLMRSTAQVNKRDPARAEKMVGSMNADSSAIKSVLSYTTEEAIANGYCEGVANSIEDILSKNGVKNYSIEKFQLSYPDKVIAFFLNPYLRSILILLIIAGIYFELQSPGIGFALLVSVVAALLYFVPSYLNGLAANWEILLFVIGLLLLMLEIFIIPGFGIAGIAGIVLTLGSLVLVMLNNDFMDFTMVDGNAFTESMIVLVVALIGGGLLIVFAGPRFMETKAFKKIILQDSQESKQGYTSNFNKLSLVGKIGTAYTVLRPSGKILIDGEVYDAYSSGDYIEKGTEVEVVDNMATSLKVRVKLS